MATRVLSGSISWRSMAILIMIEMWTCCLTPPSPQRARHGVAQGLHSSRSPQKQRSVAIFKTNHSIFFLYHSTSYHYQSLNFQHSQKPFMFIRIGNPFTLPRLLTVPQRQEPWNESIRLRAGLVCNNNTIIYLTNIKHCPPQPLDMLLKASRVPQQAPAILNPSPSPNLLHSHHCSCHQAFLQMSPHPPLSPFSIFLTWPP